MMAPKVKWILFGIVVVAILLRIFLAVDNVFDAGFINFPGPDSYYHADILRQIIDIFPDVPDTVSFWFYDWLIVAFAWVIGFGTLSVATIEYIAVFVPPFLAGCTIYFVYRIATRLFSQNVGYVSAFLIAIMPGEYLNRTLLGRIDHHAFEVFITTGAVLLFFKLVDSWSVRSWKTWAMFTLFLLTIAVFALSWQGLFRLSTGDVTTSNIVRGSTTEALPSIASSSPLPMVHIFMAAFGGFILVRWGSGWKRFLIVAWGIAMIAATIWQVRFDYYLIVPMALLLGYTIDRLYNAVTFKELMIPRALSVMILGIVLYLTIPSDIGLAKNSLETPSKEWNEALVWVRDNTPDDSLIIAWWDYGYWIRYRAERTEYINGGQDFERIKEIASVFLSDTDTGVPGNYLIIDENTAYHFNRAMMWWLGASNTNPASMDTMAKRLYELQPVDGYRYLYGDKVKVFEVKHE